MVDTVLFGNETSTLNIGPKILGGKGANLVEMSNLGLPVPAGIIIPTTACNEYRKAESFLKKKAILNSAVDAVLNTLYHLKMDGGFLPLMSVRSGARVSMPGMLDSILNVGITPGTVTFWKDRLGERGFLDCQRRFYQMYGTTVFGLEASGFEDLLTSMRKSQNVKFDSALSALALQTICEEFESISDQPGEDYPITLRKQLSGSIKAVWDSWDSPRAKHYRGMHGYPDSWGTAVIIQAMVFGNLNDKSCSGVMFTRDPVSGENHMYGDFLVNAQGEDVVNGIRETQPIHELEVWNSVIDKQLGTIAQSLEDHYGDMQDTEFTVQDGELFMLQTRTGKRSSQAAFRIVGDMIKTGILTYAEAFKRVSVKDYVAAQLPVIDPQYKGVPFTTGLPAGGGIVTGEAVFSSEYAVLVDGPCILIKNETDPNDIVGMEAALGILTRTGGTTSHAAVVARGMNKTCVVGAIDLNLKGTALICGDIGIQEGELISIDGKTGKVWQGEVPVIDEGLPDSAKAFIEKALESVNLLPIGRTYLEAHNGRVLIPFSMYGVGGEDDWIHQLEVAIDKGLEVYTDPDPNLKVADKEILGLFGSTIHKATPEIMHSLLGASGLSDKVKILAIGGSVSLEMFLEGSCPTTLSGSQIDELFGSQKAYDMIVEMMEKTGVTKPEAFVVNSIIKQLSKIFTKEA